MDGSEIYGELLGITDVGSVLVGYSYLMWKIIAAIFIIAALCRFAIVKKAIGWWAANGIRIILMALPFFIIVQAIAIGIIFQIDTQTSAIAPEEKIAIIEIDDFWNLQGGQFEEYGYSMENYEDVIGTIEEHGFRATFGASPYIFIETDNDILALRDDRTMVEYLIEKQELGHEIAMHGYAHCRHEASCPEYEENYLNIVQGKKELETLLGSTIITYLPPGNRWEEEQYGNVKRAGFRVIPNTHVEHPYWDGDVLITERGYDVVSSWDWYGHSFGHSGYEEWVEACKEREVCIIQLHCNTFDSQEKLEDLDMFLSYLEQENIRVVTYSEAYGMLK